MRASFWGLLFFFSNIVYGNSTSQVVVDSLSLIRLENNRQKLQVTTRAGSQLHPYQIVTLQPFATHYLLLGPYANSVNISFEFKALFNEKIQSNPYLHKRQLPKASINHFSEVLAQINHYSLNPSVKFDLSAFFEKLQQQEMPADFIHYLYQELLTVAVANADILVVNGILDIWPQDISDNIVYQCSSIEGIVNLDETNEINLLTSKLAASMYEVTRHYDEQSNKFAVYVETRFKQACSAILSQLLSKDVQLHLFTKNAHQLFKNVIDRFHPQEPILEALTLKNIWLFHNFNDEHLKAENSVKAALNLLISAPLEVALKAELYDRLFTSLIRRGAYGEAKYYLNIALELETENERIHTLSILFNLGFLNYYVGEYDIALNYFQQSLLQLQQVGKPLEWQSSTCINNSNRKLDIARSALMIGSMYRLLDDLVNTNKWHQCAYNLLKDSNDYYEVVASNELAFAASQQQKFEEVQLYTQATLKDKRALTTQKIDALTLALESKSHTNNAEDLRSELDKLAKLFGYNSFYSRAFTEDPKTPYPLKQIAALRVLILLHQNDIHRQWQDKFITKAMKIISNNLIQVNNPQAWNAARFRFIESYIDTMYDSKKQSWLISQDKLFTSLEKYYSLEPQFEKNHYAYPIQSSPISKFSLTSANSWQKRLALPPLKDPKPALLTNMSLTEVQNAMENDEILIRYFFTEKVGYAFVVNKEHAFVLDIGNQNQIDVLLEQQLALIKNTSPSITQMNKLTNLLLPIDLIKSKKFKKLVIIPDGKLHRFPFSALNISHDFNQYKPLTEKLQVLLTSSASHYYSLESPEKRVKSNLKIAIFANPTFIETNNGSTEFATREGNGLNARPLPGTQYEADTISQLFSHLRIQVATETQATKEFLMSQENRNADILHIATHGYNDPDKPEHIGLITARNKYNNKTSNVFLSLGELLSKPVNNRLVVISGCETYLGKHYKGSGMRSTTRGFLSQGAGSVIATLWPIQDKVSSRFMARFYNHLKNNVGNTGQALQQTQKEFSKRGPYRHPKYWAGFVLTVSNRQYETINLN